MATTPSIASETLIPRPEYLDRLIYWQDKNIIKVITGVRRCGKSTLLKLMQEHLRQSGVTPPQIQAFNFEDVGHAALIDYKQLHQQILANIVPDQANYIFLDEVQQVPQFQKMVASLMLRKNIDVYITGSNAYLLSGDLATHLTGRYIEIMMLPFSFKEYVTAIQATLPAPEKPRTLPEYYQDYIQQSGFPFAYQIDALERRRDYLKMIVDSVLLKDVINHHRIDNPTDLARLIVYLSDTIGSITSPRGIAGAITARGQKMDARTIEKYLQAIESSFLFYRAQGQDIEGKQIFKNEKKYYLVDLGLRQCLLAKPDRAYGRILENVVFLELLRRDYHVFIGRFKDIEIDFVATKDGQVEYFQVAASVLDEATLERELRPLQLIEDNFPKYILSTDYLPASNYEGIKLVNVFAWLMDTPHPSAT